MNEPKKPKRCPQCGSRSIQLEDYDQEYVYIYCEDCDESFEIPIAKKSNSQHQSDSHYQEENN